MHEVGPFILCQGQGLNATLHPALPGRVYYIVMSKIGTPDSRLPISTSMGRIKSLRQLSKPGKASRLDLNTMLCGVQKKLSRNPDPIPIGLISMTWLLLMARACQGRASITTLCKGVPLFKLSQLKLIHSMCCATQQAKRVQNTPAIYISVFLSKKKEKKILVSYSLVTVYILYRRYVNKILLT